MFRIMQIQNVEKVFHNKFLRKDDGDSLIYRDYREYTVVINLCGQILNSLTAKI